MTPLFPEHAFAGPDTLGPWRPVPPAGDRAAWAALDPQACADLVAEAQQYASEPWPQLTASSYLRYREAGDRVAYEQPYFERRARLGAAVLAAAVTLEEPWLAEVVDGVWLLCEETSWCLPAHEDFGGDSARRLPDPAQPCLDLFAAETAGLLAFTDLILGDLLDECVPELRQLARTEIRLRVLEPFRHREWWWFGRTGPANNWNPWICSNVLAANLLVESDARVRIATARRVAEVLGGFLAGYPADGGCDEGAIYWWRAGGSLFDCLEAFHQASAGALDAFGLPLVRAIARYPLAVHLGDRWQVNFGDGSALMPSHTPADLLHRFARRTGDAELAAHAVALGRLARPELGDRALTSLARRVSGLFDTEWRGAQPAEFPYPAHSWLPDLQVLAARQQAGSSAGLFLAVKGGHNDESHNHNDVGSFVVGCDGRPVLVDVGVGTYTAQTFSADRYAIWTMSSEYHNVPEIGGAGQQAGREHRASSVRPSLTDDRAELSMDLTDAYHQDAGIRSWRRTLRLDRVAERVTLADEWDLRAPAAVVMNLMTPAEVAAPVPGRLHLGVGGTSVTVEYDPQFTVEVEEIALTDAKLTATWGKTIRRIRLGVGDGAKGRCLMAFSSSLLDDTEVPV